MSLDKLSLGKELRDLRENLNITIEEVSFLADINEKTIYRIEYGKNNITKNTLDKLSKAYKIDLLPIYNKYIKNPKVILNNLVLNSKNILNIDDMNALEINIEYLKSLNLKEYNSYEVHFIKHYIILLTSTVIDVKYNDREKAVKQLMYSIKSEIHDFKIDSYKDFNYSPIEKRLLMNLGVLSNKFYNNKKSIDMLEYLLPLVKNHKDLYPKLAFNLSSIYQTKDEYTNSLNFITKGIDYSISNKNFDSLSKLFFRKFSAEINLNIDSYKDSLRRAVFMEEINKQDYIKNVILKVSKDFYSVDSGII